MKDSLTWMRDHFGRWLASTTSFTFMWLAVGLAVMVAYFWDAIWSGRQAPEGLEVSFQAGGAVVRTWTVFALVGVVALYRTKAHKLATVLLVTWLMTSIMSYGHVLGFVASGQMERYASGAAVEEVANIQTVSVEERLALLADQKASIEARLETQVANLNAEIDRIYNDRIDNDDLADPLIARRSALQDTANAQIAELDAAKLALLTEGETKAVTAQEAQVTAVKFDPLYMWIASAVHGDPTEDQLRTIAARVGAFWALLIEMIAGAGPAILYAAHAHFSDRRDDEAVKRSEAAKKGWETRKEKEARLEKVALPVTDDGYWQVNAAKAVKSNYSSKGIAQTIFKMDWHEFPKRLAVAVRKGLVTQEQYDDIMDPERHKRAKKNSVDVIAPDEAQDDTEQLSNGFDQTSLKEEDDGSTTPNRAVS